MRVDTNCFKVAFKVLEFIRSNATDITSVISYIYNINRLLLMYLNRLFNRCINRFNN